MNPSSFTPNAVIFFSLLVLSISPPRNVYSDEEKFNNCAPTFCGGKKVDYPFWGNQSPVYCGLDGFQLDCIEGKFLTLDIDDLKYNIMDIDLEHNSSFLTMNRADLLSSICPEPNGFLHTSLDHTPFRTTIADEIATFYYYCDTVAYNVPYNFTCSIWNMSHQGYFLFPGTPGDEIEELKCDITVDIPVLKSAIAAFIGKKIGVQEFLKRGLEVSWFVDLKQRVECVSSGGRCGHNSIGV